MKKSRVLMSVICLMLVLPLAAQCIAVMNDLHVSPGNDNSRWLQQAIDEINAADYDAVVVNGDLTNEGSDAELTYMHDMLSQIRHQLYVVPGNHENNWSQSATKTFLDLWGNDRFATKIGDVALVGINCGPYMKMGDAHIKQEDLHWLRATLDSLCTPGTRVISFNHYPIRKDDIDNYVAYAALLEQYPVLAHFNGHYHTYEKYMIGDIDAVMTRALFLDGNHGYNTVSIDGGVIVVNEKLIGGDETEKFRFGVREVHPLMFADTGAAYTSPEGFDVRCVHADSASVFTRIAFDDRRVYFGTSTGEAKAVDKATGQQVWSVSLGAPLFARPTVLTDGHVAFPHADGIIVVDAESGKRVESFPTPVGPYVADGIYLSDKDLYVQGGYGHIEARCGNDGMLKWSYDSINNYCQAAPVVAGNQLIFGAWDTYLRCLDVDNGDLLWRWSNGRSNNLYSPGNVVPVVTDSLVVIVAPDRYMTAIDRFTGETVWRDNSHRYRESLGCSADGNTAYAKTMDGELVAVDATSRTFNELWICDMGLGYEHAPCIVAESDNVIYAGSRRGIVTAVSPDTHKVIWQLTLGESEVNGIDLDPYDGSIWLSLIEGKIVRVVKLLSY